MLQDIIDELSGADDRRSNCTVKESLLCEKVEWKRHFAINQEPVHPDSTIIALSDVEIIRGKIGLDSVTGMLTPIYLGDWIHGSWPCKDHSRKNNKRKSYSTGISDNTGGSGQAFNAMLAGFLLHEPKQTGGENVCLKRRLSLQQCRALLALHCQHRYVDLVFCTVNPGPMCC